ncbi:MAG: hypothetical protein KBD01_19695 [Acidobacteria bacterium]|nr:hypothetical protein [Acidobacteriota bacterium]
MIVGLTGPNASGKGEVAVLLASRGYVSHSLSDVVRERALALGLDVGRATLIRVGQELRREHGPAVLAETILPRLGARAVVDSVRSPFEVAALRRRPDFRLLGLDAPVEVRWRRAVARGREGDQPSLDEFRRREALENTTNPEGQQLAAALREADAVVLNDGTLEQLRERVLAVIAAWEAEPGGPRGAGAGDPAGHPEPR